MGERLAGRIFVPEWRKMIHDGMLGVLMQKKNDVPMDLIFFFLRECGRV